MSADTAATSAPQTQHQENTNSDEPHLAERRHSCITPHANWFYQAESGQEPPAVDVATVAEPQKQHQESTTDDRHHQDQFWLTDWTDGLHDAELGQERPATVQRDSVPPDLVVETPPSVLDSVATLPATTTNRELVVFNYSKGWRCFESMDYFTTLAGIVGLLPCVLIAGGSGMSDIVFWTVWCLGPFCIAGTYAGSVGLQKLIRPRVTVYLVSCALKLVLQIALVLFVTYDWLLPQMFMFLACIQLVNTMAVWRFWLVLGAIPESQRQQILAASTQSQFFFRAR